MKKKYYAAAVLCVMLGGCVMLCGCGSSSAESSLITGESSTSSPSLSEKNDESSNSDRNSVAEESKEENSIDEKESAAEESSESEKKSDPEENKEENSMRESSDTEVSEEESSIPENSDTEEESTEELSSDPEHTLKTGSYVLDDSWETAQYINYFDGNFHSPDSEEIGRELIAALKKIKIGEETEEDYNFDYINKTVALYDFDNNKSVYLKFNGETIFIEDRFYKLIGAENLQNILNRIPDYEKPDTDSDGNIIEGPTTPFFRPFSEDDPYNTVVRYIREPKQEEISVDPKTGERFVNDQLFVILTDRNYSGEMYSISDDAGAKIIGYLDDPDNKFQFRFSEAMTREQLEKKAEELKSNKYIADAYLYIVE